jgi:hypothetical protein
MSLMEPKSFSNLKKIRRFLAFDTHHGNSLLVLSMKKLMVLLVFVVRSTAFLGVRRKTLKWTKKYKNSKTNKDLIIIGGGPSVSKMNTKQIVASQIDGSLDVMVMNWYSHTQFAEMIRPDYYVLSDPLNIPKGNNSFKSLNSDDIWKKLEQWPDSKLIVPAQWFPLMQSVQNNVACYIDDRELVGFSSNIDITKPRGYCSLTAYKAIAAGIYMGYRNVFLIGFDGSTFASTVVDEDNHLFEGKNNNSDTEFTPNVNLDSYFPNGIADLLFANSSAFLDLRKCFKNENVVNLQRDSYLDAFRKANNKYVNW